MRLRQEALGERCRVRADGILHAHPPSDAGSQSAGESKPMPLALAVAGWHAA
eukprot:CAMPEP_0174763094 /NCGR_PEP_ID=MMETSP1094-20130205/110109_1 /TAXON_ID=156173 /ORGANISM="Chrysochromulina brevifilum, Strain UTEX LB 985" /LENGTH=51 /DNA_ID=CAMNT_0015969051 /DNA_START=122 /DNA_END=277 /DNA_ORIENTATION=-